MDGDIHFSPPRSPSQIPIRRRFTEERVYLDADSERRRAPQTFYQSSSIRNRVSTDDSFRSSSSFGQFSATQSYVNLRRLFEPVFNTTNNKDPIKQPVKRIEDSYFSKRFLKPFSRQLRFLQRRLRNLLVSSLKVSLLLSGGGFLITFLFWFGLLLCISSYWLWWWSIFPTMSHSLPVFFDFDPEANGQRGFACSKDHSSLIVELPQASINLLLASHQWELHQTAVLLTEEESQSRPLKPKLKRKTKRSASEEPKFKMKKRKLQQKKKITKDLTSEEISTDVVFDWRKETLKSKTRLLAPGEQYDVRLNLRLRNNQANHELSTFMIHTQLITPKEKLLASSKRPAIVEFIETDHSFFDSKIFHFAQYGLKLIFFPFVMFFRFINWIRSLLIWMLSDPTERFYLKQSLVLDEELKKEIAHLDILLFEEFQEQSQYFLSVASVNLTLSQPCLEILDATIRFDVRLKGYRYFVYYYRWTAFFMFVVMVVIVEMNNLFILSSLVSFQLWMSSFS